MLGAVADDFTGATDLALALVGRGHRAVVTCGPPPPDRAAHLAAEADAVVVALKTRTAAPDEAVAESRRALLALREMGAERIYDKYCSTFDSTPAGNIGPVLDALAADLGARTTVVVPSFPATGRTVYNGHLFVGDRLLSESPLRDHPLTPMTDPDVRRLLAAQSRSHVDWIPLSSVRRGAEALRAEIDARAREDGTPVAIVVDAVEDADLVTIAAATEHLPLITGGSGLAIGLAPPAGGAGERAGVIPTVPGRRAVLAGSASAATRGQIAIARAAMPHRKLDLAALRADLDAEVTAITGWARERWAQQPDVPVLVHSVAELADVEADSGALVEDALARCARELVEAGVRQLIVAGGETSGAVIAALGIAELVIGPAVAPGVAWALGRTTGGVELDILLKSGNFGEPELMRDAWELLP